MQSKHVMSGLDWPSSTCLFNCFFQKTRGKRKGAGNKERTRERLIKKEAEVLIYSSPTQLPLMPPTIGY